jgi:hypothetical protein
MHSCLGSILNVFHNKMHCHTAIENVSDPIGYLLDFTNPYYTALNVLSHEHLTPDMTLL